MEREIINVQVEDIISCLIWENFAQLMGIDKTSSLKLNFSKKFDKFWHCLGFTIQSESKICGQHSKVAL